MTAVIAILVAALFSASALGGGFYETFLVDAAWPKNLHIIQPAQGGIDRKRFWMPIHFAVEASLGVALWSVWHLTSARWWVLGALAAHLVMRAWSFAWFIPRALRFERATASTPELDEEARSWVQKSRLRLPLDAAVVVALGAALANVVETSIS